MVKHTRQTGSRLAGLATLLLVSGCSRGIAVRTHYDPVGTPISATYQSFAWLTPATGASRTEPDGLEATVQEATETALVAKGYALIPLAPNFRMGWHYTTEPTEVTALYLYYPYTWGRWFPGGGVNFSGSYRTELPAGTLMLDAVDASTNELIWRSTALLKLDDHPTIRARQVTEVIRKMVARFPRP